VALSAAPFVRGEVKGFRAPNTSAGECVQGEPNTLYKDLWLKGYGWIAVVPSVNFEYTDGTRRLVKAERGYVSDWAAREEEETEPMVVE
jgi:alpha-1,3-mannosyltransferase